MTHEHSILDIILIQTWKKILRNQLYEIILINIFWKVNRINHYFLGFQIFLIVASRFSGGDNNHHNNNKTKNIYFTFESISFYLTSRKLTRFQPETGRGYWRQ